MSMSRSLSRERASTAPRLRVATSDSTTSQGLLASAPSSSSRVETRSREGSKPPRRSSSYRRPALDARIVHHESPNRHAHECAVIIGLSAFYGPENWYRCSSPKSAVRTGRGRSEVQERASLRIARATVSTPFRTNCTPITAVIKPMILDTMRWPVSPIRATMAGRRQQDDQRQQDVRRDGERERHPVTSVTCLADEDHHRRDRARPGDERHAQGNDRGVRPSTARSRVPGGRRRAG